MAFKLQLSLNQGGVIKPLTEFLYLNQFRPIIMGPNENGLIIVDYESKNPICLVNSGMLRFEIKNDDSRIVMPGMGATPPNMFKGRG